MSAAGRRRVPGEGVPSHPFPWDEALALGFGVLRLSSDAFWRMTLRELAAAARGAGGRSASGDPPGRDALAALMRAHPDA
ncbi:phage tail assembly chaperone [Alsobacter sp. SYSU M60028]|uniref:Phage tail assembly chaperone n=1 Tax=Alsobacter ponti TaxID=2962936 RepID=A0ABT1L8F3_9HYPH|nr:rcc01693 family protein [Alsobacter ponti]MCP8937782.1 phage tail assembly chaperone [Alsobacter ponti]